jgi:hypothetical protein
MDRCAARSWLIFLAANVWFTSSATAQTLIHNRLVSSPSGSYQALFEVTNGVARELLTGLNSNTFPSVSRDGRYIIISAGDPLFPNDRSGDVFEFDRVTGQTRYVIDNDAITHPNGIINYTTPLFSALRPDNRLLVVAAQHASTVPESATPRTLDLYNPSDGMYRGSAELGPAVPPDFIRPEFVGISWKPDGSVFATPWYIDVVSDRGRPTTAAGIVLYGFNPTSQSYDRLGPITQPRVFDGPNLSFIQVESHALPVFSPDGQRLAFFSIFFPDVNMLQPATAQLVTVNEDGSNPVSLIQFDPGVYPAGLSWTPDGGGLVFSVGQQSVIDGVLDFYEPRALPTTTVLRFINANGGPLSEIPGAPFGYFPSVLLDSAPMPGDYNRDGRLDMADYFAWGSTFGAAVQPGTGADGNGGGFIDAADYVIWRNAVSAGAAANAASVAVPEPGTGVVLAGGIAAVLLVAGRRSRYGSADVSAGSKNGNSVRIS